MRSFRSFQALPKQAFARETAVAIGKFDGVHLGHQQIIATLRKHAAAQNLEPCVFTFTQNPLATLSPEDCPAPLTSVEQRLELLAAHGVGAVLMVDFTRELAKLSPETFVREVLLDALHAKLVLVGADFRFGHRGSGNLQLLKELGQQHGFQVQQLPDVEILGQRISSTSVRAMLSAGDVAGAAKLLGRPHSVRGLVVHGASRGRGLGFPTANLQPLYEGFTPAEGVYACVAHVLGKKYAAAVSIGGNPTFTPEAPSQIEVHLLDFNDNIYGQLLRVDFIARLRPMTAYQGLEALITQMHADVAETAKLIGNPDQF